MIEVVKHTQRIGYLSIHVPAHLYDVVLMIPATTMTMAEQVRLPVILYGNEQIRYRAINADAIPIETLRRLREFHEH